MDFTSVGDDAMKAVKRLFGSSGKTLDQLGLEMGYPAETARKSAWQFLTKTSDPRLSMLRRFAKAVGVDVRGLFEPEEKKASG